MLKPSYTELIDTLNKQNTGENEITSRYTIVIAAAKRARQIIDGDEPMVTERKGKPLSTAVNEMFNDKIKIVGENEGTILNLSKVKDEDFISLNENPSLDITTVEIRQEENINTEQNLDEYNSES